MEKGYFCRVVFPLNRIAIEMTYNEFCRMLTARYDRDEARAVARMVLEVGFGLSMADVLGGAVEQLSADSQQRLRQLADRLMEGEPVQYVLGLADFGPRQFLVEPGVLIPRPETYELCQWVQCTMNNEQCTMNNEQCTMNNEQCTMSNEPCRILDIGTGSGCIACTLAAEMPHAQLTAWDLSPVALAVAKRNAERLAVNIDFEQRDMLKVRYGSDSGRWDIIVSNPPYVCDSEADDMADWVLDYEPEIALFVPDDDPLLFYLHISNYAQSALREGGQLFFEINPRFDEAIEDILLGLGFDDITVRQDQFGKNRFVKARWH